MFYCAHVFRAVFGSKPHKVGLKDEHPAKAVFDIPVGVGRFGEEERIKRHGTNEITPCCGDGACCFDLDDGLDHGDGLAAGKARLAGETAARAEPIIMRDEVRAVFDAVMIGFDGFARLAAASGSVRR